MFNYRGRLPTRSDGKARREALLKATLELIINDGVRGVRHRAVATKAAVPLAATTYYFADIYDLIHDAFIYFMESVMQQAKDFENKSFQLLENLNDSDFEHDKMVSKVASFATDYFYQQSLDKDSRILEQVIRTQALRDEKIADIIQTIEQRQISNIVRFLEKLNLSKRTSRARLIYGLFLRLKYELSANLIDLEQAAQLFDEGLSLAFAKDHLAPLPVSSM